MSRENLEEFAAKTLEDAKLASLHETDVIDRCSTLLNRARDGRDTLRALIDCRDGADFVIIMKRVKDELDRPL